MDDLGVIAEIAGLVRAPNGAKRRCIASSLGDWLESSELLKPVIY